MVPFRYTATDADGKTIDSVIDAPSLEAARTAIEDMDLELQKIEPASRNDDGPAELPSLASTFAFEGTDQSGMPKRGSIQAGSKYEAFEKLRQDQDLFLTMLSPVGVTPQYRDHDLENWQKSLKKPILMPLIHSSSIVSTNADSKQQAAKGKPKSVSFLGVPQEAKELQTQATIDHHSMSSLQREYHPLISTLRLYSGWLLAWYGLFVAIGYYTHVRVLPSAIPFVEAFYLSPLIFSFTLAVFIFLLATTIYTSKRGSVLVGVVLSIIGATSFVVVRWLIAGF